MSLRFSTEFILQYGGQHSVIHDYLFCEQRTQGILNAIIKTKISRNWMNKIINF